MEVQQFFYILLELFSNTELIHAFLKMAKMLINISILIYLKKKNAVIYFSLFSLGLFVTK